MFFIIEVNILYRFSTPVLLQLQLRKQFHFSDSPAVVATVRCRSGRRSERACGYPPTSSSVIWGEINDYKGLVSRATLTS